MAQHDYVIDNQTAPNFRADLNNALLAIVSNNSGSSAPSTTYANMIWYDSGADILRMRSEADDAWINLGTLDQAANTFAANILLASQAEAEAGSNNTKAMTPLRTAQAITALVPGGLGNGQTWQNVTGSRSLGTTYTNSTGKPIVVLIATTLGGNEMASIFANISGVSMTIGRDGSAGTFGGVGNIIVPIGATYSITIGGPVGLSTWHELR